MRDVPVELIRSGLSPNFHPAMSGAGGPVDAQGWA